MTDMVDILAIAAIVLVVGAALFYIIRAKRRGDACVGCPYAKKCGGGCGGCHRTESDSEQQDK